MTVSSLTQWALLPSSQKTAEVFTYLKQTYTEIKSWVNFNCLEQGLNPGLPHHRQQSYQLCNPACFNLKGLEVYKCIWKKHAGKSSEKFCCQEQELNLGLPHVSQWFNTLSYSPVLALDCRGISVPQSCVNGGEEKKHSTRCCHQELNTDLLHRKQKLNPTSYDVCGKVESVEAHTYL